ncbi:Leucyl aminopeptidase (aminopeptidase T) [Paenibacillus sophorae]|uniref:Aminopeptidase n=1 Tax=Paenibacillus sophorae TaxID=1333845 RepID=A0A1H8KAT0_9BACL|nr:aminopeptidase [Paenibacillus sophorae]QWU13668.1 aminopeptidase [Paenibacillus sophorae]SEN89801.1 Leucyl aminopeptidase (aminopeptidase T) [Paenibacillus sophorae]
MDFKQKLENYALLAVKVGVNIQPGQTLVVNADIASAELVRLVVRKAYEAGAKLVKVNYSDEVVTRTRYDLAPEVSFSEPPKWFADEMEDLAQNNACFLTIISTDPDLLNGVDPGRIRAYQLVSAEVMASYRQLLMSNHASWSGVAYPSASWAAKVFPDAPEEERIHLLWDAIFRAVRADVENPLEAWQLHLDGLKRRCDKLNERKYRKLHYTAPGTDLTVELPEGHIWCQAGAVNAKGVPFLANIPTEEVFSVPHRDGTNGTVSSTKPLSYAGNIIDRFTLTFKDGRVTDYTAEVGQDKLDALLSMDEGAVSLGEVALVPHRSPISASGILYYTTLFDENASCHLALGGSYAFTLEGGTALTKEQLAERGMNQSLIHVDFMMGSPEMNIDGITEDGTVEPIFRNGGWA